MATRPRRYKRPEDLAVGDRVYAGNGYDDAWAEVESITHNPDGSASFVTTVGTQGYVRPGFEILTKA